MARTEGSYNSEVRQRFPKIVQGLMEGRSVASIAEEFPVTQWALYGNIENPELQQILEQIFYDLLPTLGYMVVELWNSDAPEDRREAARICERMWRHVTPRKANIDIRSFKYELTEERKRDREDLAKLSPGELDEFIRLQQKMRE